MFLVNVGAAAIEAGLNCLYVTLEMADYKIGLRFDSYFSGVEINSIPEHQQEVEQAARAKVKGRLWVKEFPTKGATVQTIRSYIQRLQATKNFTPDVLVLDYADLMRGSRGYADKRFELEGNYEELRALAQEFNMVAVTADQTNRSGLDQEIVSISQIGESYAKATVCDLIMTVSRTMEDKQQNTGRLFIAKSRLGKDGVIYPFILNPATVKVRLLDETVDIEDILAQEQGRQQKQMAKKYDEFLNKRTTASSPR
jgi:replicative DNA helicase